MDISKIDKLLLKNFPKQTTEIPDKFSKLVFTKPVHLIATGLAYRKIAKDLSIKFTLEYMAKHNSKYPPVYLTKACFIMGSRDSKFNESNILEKWNKASVVVFDGIDEIKNQNDMNWIAEFISPLIAKPSPLIVISSGNLNEDVYQEYGAMSFGIQLLDLEVINLNE